MGLQDTLRAVADPTRRRILELLRRERMSAGEIGECFSMSAPAVSKHLNVLKAAGIVRDAREGRHIYYELNASVLEEALIWLTDLREGRV